MELAVLGWSQYQIAADLGISQAAVSKILKRIETRILQELAETVERQKARHTLRLEHLFAEAMRAWEQSKADSTRRRQRKAQGGAGGAGAIVAEVVVENQHGDPRYLDEARKALGDHRKIWGLDAPRKVDVRASRNPYDGMTEDDLRAELDRQARLLGPSDERTTTDRTRSDPSTITRPEPPDANHQ
jgi:transcriptional regulator with XRE-family HTH domain